MLKKSQNYFGHDHGKKTKRILYICSAKSRKVFQSFFLQKKYRCGAKGLSISWCYQAVAAFFNMPREDHIFGWIFYFIYDMWWITRCSRWIGHILKSYFGVSPCLFDAKHFFLLFLWWKIHGGKMFATKNNDTTTVAFYNVPQPSY